MGMWDGVEDELSSLQNLVGPHEDLETLKSLSPRHQTLRVSSYPAQMGLSRRIKIGTQLRGA